MKEKIKKQKKKMLCKIALVMFCAWLVISAAFCAVVIHTDKVKLINHSLSESARLIDGLSKSDFSSQLYYIDAYKMNGNYVPNTYRNNTNHDLYSTDVQIRMGLLSDGYTELVNTDKDIVVQFGAVEDNMGKVYLESSIISFEDFKALLGDKNYETIREYLAKEPDKEGRYYVLLCTEFYYDKESSHTIPKKLELMLSSNDSTWYSDDEVVFTYELSPKEVSETAKLYKSGVDQRNILPRQFVLDELSSGGLIPDTSPCFSDEDFLSDMSGIAGVETTGLFTYTVNQIYVGPVEMSQYDEILSNTEMQEYMHNNILVCYAQRINVLKYSYPTLIAGVSVILLFFLAVGIILTVMLWKILKTQMEEEQKRTDITNALAHDIKTPLFIIEGYARNLKENINTDKRDHYATRIIDRTQEVNDLVHKMLCYSELDSTKTPLQTESIDLCQLAKDVSEEFHEVSHKSKLSVTCCDKCFINANREYIKRVLMNLVDNALRYCDEGTAPEMIIDKTRLSISNVCSTLTAEDVKHITEPYYKGDKARSGSSHGLGLSIVKSILDMHNFTLDIKFADNVITFTIQF